jgi:hypothetical protein
MNFYLLIFFQQGRLFPHLAAAFAINIFSNNFSKIVGDFNVRIMMGDKSDEMVRKQEWKNIFQIHSLLACICHWL